jgi:GntR family transcriptional repressor for pyruvate dehydrogenase complex
LSETAGRNLLAMIADGTYAPDSQLPSEHALMQQMGVGRSTIREALRGLVLAGVLSVENGVGYFVSSWTGTSAADSSSGNSAGLTDPENLLEARLVLERQIVALAVQRATQEELNELDEILVMMEAAADDAARLDHLGSYFHERVAAAAHNPTLSALLHSLQLGLLATIQAVRIVDVQHDAPQGQLESHRRLYETLRKRDVQAADDVIVQHILEWHGVPAPIEKPLASSAPRPDRGPATDE